MSLNTGKTLKDHIYDEVNPKSVYDNASKFTSKLTKDIVNNDLTKKTNKSIEQVKTAKNLYSGVESTVQDILAGKKDKDVTDIVSAISEGKDGPTLASSIGGFAKDIATFDYGNARQGDVSLHVAKTTAKTALNSLGPPGMIINALWSIADMVSPKSGGYKGY
jgi:hypothetical protein